MQAIENIYSLLLHLSVGYSLCNCSWTERDPTITLYNTKHALQRAPTMLQCETPDSQEFEDVRERQSQLMDVSKQRIYWYESRMWLQLPYKAATWQDSSRQTKALARPTSTLTAPKHLLNKVTLTKRLNRPRIRATGMLTCPSTPSTERKEHQCVTLGLSMSCN